MLFLYTEGIEDVVLWENRNPYLYRAEVILEDSQGAVTEAVPCAVGFRRIELRDKVTSAGSAPVPCPYGSPAALRVVSGCSADSFIHIFTLPREGVEQAVYVWLNGQFVGYAEDTFTPSEFDLTPFIRELSLQRTH